jgi:heme-degrading monooxygenase HmoA
MTDHYDHYASGTWQVTPGCEEQFVQRWTEFLTWSRGTFPALIQAHLLRDKATPRHFVSFAEWTNPEDRTAWKESPGFEARFMACRALCEAMSGSDYDHVVVI